MRSTGTPTRWGPRLLRAALVGVLLTLSVGVMAAPAQAATINCTPMADIACKDLTPIVECIWSNGDGTYAIAWGWNNPSADTLYIDFGGKNKMAPGADDQGQPTLFTPGLQHNVFVTTGSGNRTWTLGNNKAVSGSSTPACPTKPVSLIGNGRALLLGLALMAVIGLPVVAARRNGREVSA
jgi:hypothetical protein